MSRLVVVGAGPAGLAAAYRLQAAGHDVAVLEAADVPGGRTHTEHFGPGHWSDTGAGWFLSSYPDTLALLDELGMRSLLRVLPMRGGGDLLVDGRLEPNPNSIARILTTRLATPAEKVRFFAWMAGLFLRQPGQLRPDQRYDGVRAIDDLAAIGRGPREGIVRPSFEGPFFARLDEMSATLVRSWLRALSIGTFYQVEGGTDVPFRRLGELVGVRTGVRVERIAPADGGVVVDLANGPEERYDGAVVATPAPVTARIVEASACPPAIAEIEFAPHVRLYATRRAAGPPRSGIHAFPNETVATVELSAGRHGGWGRIPDELEWALVCAPSATSSQLMELPDDEVIERLWREASKIDPRLFDLGSAELVHLIRWPYAVPKVGVGYYARLRSIANRPPIAFAGDWLVQPCVEGAVRSGNAAAALFGSRGRVATGTAAIGSA